MRLPRSPVDTAILSTLLFPLLTGAVYDCQHFRVNKEPFNLGRLGGPKSVMHGVKNANREGFTNTTYTIDLCQPLRPKKGALKKDRCPNNTRVCAIEHFVGGGIDSIMFAFPIAGELLEYGGKPLGDKWSLLKDSTSNEESKKEGLLLEMGGGFNNVTGKAQKVNVEFLCDKNRDGLENLYDSEDQYVDGIKKRESENEGNKEGDKKDKDLEDDGPESASLQFVRYDNSNADFGVLHLKWRSKYACKGSKAEQDAENSTAHWGFFTWFILIAFLSTATYLIFGSWLNYNRYGARGWDLLPHGDAIRDVPYLLKDWTRRVMSSVQGGGSRGGYAAV